MAANGLSSMINVAKNKNEFEKTLNIDDKYDFNRGREVSSFNFDTILDSNTDYLHIILTSEEDQASTAKVQDVVDLSLMMKKYARRYKLVTIGYMAKGNQDLIH